MGVDKRALRDVAAANAADDIQTLGRRVVDDLRAWREVNPRSTRVILDVVEVDALLRLIDSSTTGH